MQEEIKCPQCGGSKFYERENNKYKCMYCGTTFSVKKPEEVKANENVNQTNTSPKVTVNVNMDAVNRQKPQNNIENQVVKGMAGGAGLAAGGCLTGTAIAIIVPIAIFIFIIFCINSCVQGCSSAFY